MMALRPEGRGAEAPIRQMAKDENPHPALPPGVTSLFLGRAPL